jgi:hypothetical protein
MIKAKIKDKALLKEHGIKNPINYKWCSYCQTFHKKQAFYNNTFMKDGLQAECKVVSRLRTYRCSYEEALNTLPKREQRLFQNKKAR